MKINETAIFTIFKIVVKINFIEHIQNILYASCKQFSCFKCESTTDTKYTNLSDVYIHSIRNDLISVRLGKIYAKTNFLVHKNSNLSTR